MTIDEIVSGWSDEYRKQAEPLIRRINELLSKGIPAQQAVTLAIAETGFVGAIAEELKNNRYLNVKVKDIVSADIGEWTDDHPLNKCTTADAEYARLFPAK